MRANFSLPQAPSHMRGVLQVPRMPFFFLACLFALGVGWGTASGDGDAPAGCEGVFDSTTRGGASASVSGGGCNIFRRTGDGKVSVVRVVDGDTIKVSGGRRVRYIGIDTPEVADDPQYFGLEATRFNKALVAGRKVTLEKDVSERDRFGRLLRFVYSDGILVNAELVREGYARARAYPPDSRYAQCFAALEREAREAGRGMWARP